MTTLSQLRANALGPILYADCIPNGVLHSVGFACWEMPPTATRGGYMHFIRSPYHADYEATLIPALREAHGIITTRQQVEDVDECLHASAQGAMDLDELATTYAVGNSLCLQNCVFAPDRSVDGDDTAHDYVDEITAIRAAWGGALYVHVGMANNPIFPTGSPRFNIAYALQCRSFIQNPARVLLDHPTFGIGETDYVHGGTANEGGLPDLNSSYKPMPRCIYDPSHPSVAALSLSTVSALVGEFGTQLRYVVHGESGFRIGAVAAECSTSPLDFDCSGCEPKTPYSAWLSTSFQSYLQGVLGLATIGDVNDRWGTDLASFGAIDTTSPTVFCPGNPVGLQDYFDFLDFLGSELALQEGLAAKSGNTSAQVSVLRFGPLGCERSGLDGDFGSVGDWGGETPESYAADRVHPLELVALGGRLTGVPPSFAITAPPAYTQDPPPTAVGVPHLLLNKRGYDADPVGWFFRDILTAGSTHIGYLRAAAASLAHDPPSLTAITDGIEAIVQDHPVFYAGMGALQRLVLHVDEAGNLSQPDLDNGAGRLTWHMVRRLRERHESVAIMQSSRTRNRPLSGWWLDRSVVVVPHHSGIDALQTEYAATYPDGAPGAAIFVEENPAAVAGTPDSLPAWVDDTALLQTSRGTLFRDADPTNCFYFASMPARECSSTDSNHDRVALVLASQVIPHVTANYLGDAFGVGFAASPITVAPGASTALDDVAINHVTDGLNFTVKVANMQNSAKSVTLGVDADIAGTALDVTYDPQVVSLLAYETKTVLLEAEPSGIDIAAAIADADSKLDTLEGLGAYDTAAGRACLAQASALLAEHPGRALAAYVAAVRMLYVLTSYAAPDLTVTVRRIGIVGEGATALVSGCRVQLLFPLNGREEQAAEGTTNGSGVAVVAVGAPTQERWDFGAGELAAPGAGAGDLVEVLVHDPVLGTSTRASVDVS